MQKNGCKKEKNLRVKAKISSYLSTVEPGTGGFWNFLKGRSLSGWNHYESTNADNYYFVCKIEKYRIPVVTIGRLAVYCALNNVWAAFQSKCRLRTVLALKFISC